MPTCQHANMPTSIIKKVIIIEAFQSYLPVGGSTSTQISSSPKKRKNHITHSIYNRKKKAVTSAEVELEDYLAQPTANMQIKPLKWWKDDEELFPNLSKMGRNYLAIPGTSASSKCLFSSGRQLITTFFFKYSGMYVH
jgi:hAT family C-terminal dimerisation region